jgi:hypothetical protein
MDHEYDLFEIFPDGSAFWRITVSDPEAAIARSREFAALTANEVRFMQGPQTQRQANVGHRIEIH